MHQVCYITYQVFFCFSGIEAVVKHCDVEKLKNQHGLKTFLLLSKFSMVIQVSGKNAPLTQKCYFSQKTTNKQSWKLSKDKSWGKPNIENISRTKPLNLEL